MSTAACIFNIVRDVDPKEFTISGQTIRKSGALLSPQQPGSAGQVEYQVLQAVHT